MQITIEVDTLSDEALVLLFHMIDGLIDTEPGDGKADYLIQTLGQISEEMENRFGQYDDDENNENIKIDKKLSKLIAMIREAL